MTCDHPAPPLPSPLVSETVVERLVPLKEVCLRTTFDRSTVRRLSAQGKFPRLRRKGDRRVFVLESELVAWMRT